MKTKLLFTMIAIVAAIGLTAATTLFISDSAQAKISSADTGCTNSGGNQPGGQQPSCQGSGLTQETENQNPAGEAPPGQNK
jgi:methionine salvage enolase-phosphatase E1